MGFTNSSSARSAGQHQTATWMQAIYNQALPPSGHEHAISLRLTPKTVLEGSYTLRNLVLARTNKLEIFDVVLLGASGQEARLQHIASHTVHGIVTGLERVRTLDTAADGRHRLLVAFRDAKLSLMEWSPEAEELVPVSLHSYERLPEVVSPFGQQVRKVKQMLIMELFRSIPIRAIGQIPDCEQILSQDVQPCSSRRGKRRWLFCRSSKMLSTCRLTLLCPMHPRPPWLCSLLPLT